MNEVDTAADTLPAPPESGQIRVADAPCDSCKKKPWKKAVAAQVTTYRPDGTSEDSTEHVYLCEDCVDEEPSCEA